MTKVLTDARSIRIKGRSFLAVVLSPDLPLDQWLERLDDLAARSAGFFLDRPVVLDVSELSIKKAELKQLIDDLAARKVRIMGIEGARPSQLTPEMPPAMKGGKPASDVEVTAQEPETEAEAEVAAVVSPAPQRQEAPQVRAIPQSLTIDEPVRSGQSIIFPEGDITIVGSVASGAEVIAGGSIHIYGTLRGRAMAGSIGNSNARIFCRRLEAELIAIDGIYKMAEDMDSSLRGHAVQLSLEGETIMADILF
ncbi:MULTISPECIES: septum site-determining protein MinC [Rhizobium]|uniref:Probable septum site-determining protein MinC n=1 Tax=Rhizobium wenxiniae TaxID=1737357 RepID=A0A7W9Y4J3_9HYPH|nr:septum site-determining protein MinC [Rhizobium wenxiniae]MBB6161722.1 septum site-determining protein MinC [Rhizobium wenxiniae]GGF91091.1 putative septum site-determining protein MinC [Rhizobium wenxiniae]